MAFLLIIGLGISAWTAYSSRRIEHPVILFVGVWTIIFFFYILQVFRINELNGQMFILLLLMILSFAFGAGLYEIVQSRRNERLVKTKDLGPIVQGHSLREGVFFSLCAITILVMAIDEIEIIQRVLSGMSFEQIMREAEGKGTVEISGALRVALYLFIVHPMTAIASPVCAIEYFSKKRVVQFIWF